MKKFAVLSFLFLVGCGPMLGPVVNSQYNPITMNRLYAAEANYKVANDGAYAYRNLRPCRKSETASLTNLCRRYSVYISIQRASKTVNDAFVVARKCVKDSTTNIDCISALEAAISAYSSQVTAANAGAQ